MMRLKIICNKMNDIDDKIEMNWNISRDENVFLDVCIFVNDDSDYLQTKPYQKPINTYLYPLYSSHHPPHTFIAIIAGECIRYLRLSNSEKYYNEIRKLFYIRLIEREYPHKLIMKVFSKYNYSVDLRNYYLDINRININKKKKEEKSAIPFIIPYKSEYTQRYIKKAIYQLKYF